MDSELEILIYKILDYFVGCVSDVVAVDS